MLRRRRSGYECCEVLIIRCCAKEVVVEYEFVIRPTLGIYGNKNHNVNTGRPNHSDATTKNL